MTVRRRFCCRNPSTITLPRKIPSGSSRLLSIISISRQPASPAEQLPFEDDTFDLVVGVYVVHHLARPRVVFESVCRVTKPGGHFAFTIPDQLRQASFGSFFSAVTEHHE